MSIEALSWVLQHSDTVGTDKVVLLGIANHADNRGRNAWPSVATLARYANVTARAVQQSIRRMADEGHLKVTVGGGGDEDTRADRRPNRYSIVGMNGTKQTAPRDTDDTKSPSPRTGRSTVHPEDLDGVKPSAPRGEAQRAHGVKPTSPKPSLNRQEPIASGSDDEMSNVVPLVPSEPASAGRPRDELFDAVAAVCSIDTGKLTKQARGGLNNAVKELRALQATPGNVRFAARRYRSRFSGIPLTPSALTKHWPTLGREVASDDDQDGTEHLAW